MTQPPESQTTPKSARTARTTKWVVIGLCLTGLAAGLIYLARPAILTPDCGPPTLVLGTTKFRIEPIEPAADGSLAVPADSPEVAYWVEGTNTNYVFALSPAPNNLALETLLKTGDQATVTWANCNSTTYQLSAPSPGPLDNNVLFDQSASAITIFARQIAGTEEFMVKGVLVGEEINTFNTPVSDGSEIQAEIGLLETTTLPEEKTIRIRISIYNWGQSAFTLSTSDISLTQPDGAPLILASSEPSLPKEIARAATETFNFTFPRPSTQTATLKIFTVEYDIEGY